MLLNEFLTQVITVSGVFAQHLQHAQAHPGGVVFRQGDIGREFFIIFAGSVSVSLMDETTGKVAHRQDLNTLMPHTFADNCV